MQNELAYHPYPENTAASSVYGYTAGLQNTRLFAPSQGLRLSSIQRAALKNKKNDDDTTTTTTLGGTSRWDPLLVAEGRRFNTPWCEPEFLVADGTQRAACVCMRRGSASTHSPGVCVCVCVTHAAIEVHRVFF